MPPAGSHVNSFVAQSWEYGGGSERRGTNGMASHQIIQKDFNILISSMAVPLFLR